MGKAQEDGNRQQPRHLKRIPTILAAGFFLFMVLTPPPRGLVAMMSEPSPVGYRLQSGTKTITGSVNKVLKADLSPEEIARKAKVMIAVLFMAALLWATEAIPLGATDLLVGALLYLFFILPFDTISKAYMQDAVFFIFGVLTIALGVGKVGLDRRIGLLMLSGIRGIKGFCFIFLPLLAIAAGFLSEHALIAILAPVLLRAYRLICDAQELERDRPLALMLLLGICFAANQGGPGSPAAGGRNAVMVGYLKDHGAPISFGQWVFYSLPFVLVCSLAVGAAIYLMLGRRVKSRNINFSQFFREEVQKLGPMSRGEITMAVILALVVVLWVAGSKQFGLGGPCVFGVVLMLIAGTVSWKDIQLGVRFDVVGLYAAACAMGVGLKITGGSLWLARSAIDLLPPSLRGGDSLLLATSLFTATMTNFMSDGATVASVGPVALAMASVSGVHVWKVGFACAFSSSFANMLIVGTPNNAIAYVSGEDPRTGERLVHLKDFLLYGIPVTLIACLTLWLWTILGYWRWMNWP